MSSSRPVPFSLDDSPQFSPGVSARSLAALLTQAMEDTGPWIANNAHSDDESDGDSDFAQFGMCGDVAQLSAIAAPAAVAALLQAGVTFVCVFYVAKHDSLQATVGRALAGCGLAIMLTELFGRSLFAGIAANLGTAGSRAMSHGNLTQLTQLLNRTICLELLAAGGACAASYYGRTILEGLNLKQEVTHPAGEFLKWRLIGLPLLAVHTALTRYLQAQHIFVPNLAISVVALAAAAVTSWFCYERFELGLTTAPLGLNAADLITCILQLFYIGANRQYWTEDGFGLTQGWSETLRANMFGVLLNWIETWIITLQIFMAAVLGTVEAAVQTILFSLVALCIAVPQGLSVAATTQLALLMSAGHGINARQSAAIAFFLSAAVSLAVGTLLLVSWQLFPRLYSIDNDSPLLPVMDAAYPYMVLFVVAEGFRSIVAGILRGAGRVKTSANLTSLGYYVLGLPLSLVLAWLFHMGLEGLWTGMAAAVAAAAVLLLLFLCTRVHWGKEARRIRLRNYQTPEVRNADVKAATPVSPLSQILSSGGINQVDTDL